MRGSGMRPRNLLRFISILGVLATALLAQSHTQPASVPASPGEEDGPAYTVTRFGLAYLRENPGHVPLEQIAQTPVTLSVTGSGWVSPRVGLQTVTRPLADWNTDAPQTYYASAIQHILETIRDAYQRRGLLGIYVAPDPQQISDEGKDLRPGGQTTLRIIITTGIVTELRTLAHGERISPEQRINHPAHARLAARSPVRPYVEGDARRGDLIFKRDLDEYAIMLSRHPGRRVDMALSPSPEVGGVVLDYLVTETKPWLLYAQLSNTGTENTSRVREQFGFRHYQLTGNDDVLSLDYATSDFSEFHSITAGYDARLGDADALRWRIYGGWSEYTASDVGVTDDDFSGESAFGGLELTANLFQRGPFFLDAVAGARYEHIAVDNTLPGSDTGSEDFIVPYVGLRAERLSDTSILTAGLTLEFPTTGADSDDLDNLGRPGADDDVAILRLDGSFSFYLEPLFNPRAWADPANPKDSTLAHELFFGLRSQWSLGDRLIPQYEMVAGGLWTVRGYPEAVVAGDSVVVGTAEYRFHLPRALGLEAEPRRLFGRPFRVAPQQVFGPTDWDFILRAFVDVGHVVTHGGDGFPRDSQTLIGAGVGFEIQIKRNVTFRLDWGRAMKSVDDLVGEGDDRVHFNLVLLY